MIELLLKRGANPELRATNGKTPLDYAVELKNEAAQAVLRGARP